MEGSNRSTLLDATPVSWRAWGLLLVVGVGSRLATTITYIEDPDSLRFALSVAEEYDVAAFQPHFPGYPVFWAAGELGFLLTGSFSAGFSLVGGLAIVGIVWALVQLRGTTLDTTEGLAIAGMTVANPLLWMLSNRYMPDLLGVACALVSLVFLLRALDATDGRRANVLLGFGAGVVGVFGAGLLAGLRLSTLPLLLVPVFGVLWTSSHPIRPFVAGVVGVVVWLVPLVLDTGVATLYDVAWTQTTGHFTEFGGTIQTEPNVLERLSGVLRGLWADGLGAWWPGRHAVTALVGLGVLMLGAAGVRRLARSRACSRLWGWLGACVATYSAWVFFFQNVVHKSRHVLPLVPFLILPVAAGAVAVWQRGRLGRVVVGAAAVAYGSVALVLVTQHLDPTAIAQAKRFLTARADRQPIRVASVPLVNDYLRAQRVDARYVSVEDSARVRDLRSPDAPARTTYVVGTYSSLLERPADTAHTFYHNPFVNRMWPEVTVYVYDP